jgi:hypothetical protein
VRNGAYRTLDGKIANMQLFILSAASQRDDRGVELPANIEGEAARKVVDKLI